MTPTTSLPADLFPLRAGRVHEVTGPAAAAFALIQCHRGARVEGAAMLWVRPGWNAGIAFPQGLAALIAPERLLIAETAQETDTLAVAEEALKDGSLPFVLIQTTRPLNLREGRRLQLAAQAGGTTGLCLTPQDMGSNAAQTRWHCAPVFSAEDSTLMLWELKKNKSGTPGAWHVRWNWQAHRLDVVSPASLRPGGPDLPG